MGDERMSKDDVACLSPVKSRGNHRGLLNRAASEFSLWCRHSTKNKGIMTLPTAESTPRRRRSKQTGFRVRFSTVEFQEYPIILGDNPAVSSGPPLTIDWTPMSKKSVPLEDYERMRSQRRSAGQMSIPQTIRRELLLDLGFTLSEIQRHTKQATIVRYNRRRTGEMRHLSKVSELKERFQRIALNATLRRREKQKEREYLEQSLKMAQPTITKETSPTKHVERHKSSSTLTFPMS